VSAVTNSKVVYAADDPDVDCDRERTVIQPQGYEAWPDRLLLPCVECSDDPGEPVTLHAYRRVEGVAGDEDVASDA